MFRELTPSQLPKKTPHPLPKKQPEVVGDYAGLSQVGREDRAKEMTDVKAEIARLEARASEINKFFPGKVLATISGEGREITKKLDELYEKLSQLRSRLH